MTVNHLKLIRTIFVTTLALWVTDLALVAVIFLNYFLRFISAITFGFVFPGGKSSPLIFPILEATASKLMKILSYPLCLFLPGGQFGDDAVTMVLLLGANSALWGVGVGSLVWVFKHRVRKIQNERTR